MLYGRAIDVYRGILIRGIDSRNQFWSQMHGFLIIDQLWSISGIRGEIFRKKLNLLYGHPIHVYRGILIRGIDSRNQFWSKMHGFLIIDQLWSIISGIRLENFRKKLNL